MVVQLVAIDGRMRRRRRRRRLTSEPRWVLTWDEGGTGVLCAVGRFYMDRTGFVSSPPADLISSASLCRFPKHVKLEIHGSHGPVSLDLIWVTFVPFYYVLQWGRKAGLQICSPFSPQSLSVCVVLRNKVLAGKGQYSQRDGNKLLSTDVLLGCPY